MSARLYVGNLPYSCTDDDVRELFNSAGIEPTSVRVIMDRGTGLSKGFGFVEREDGSKIFVHKSQIEDGNSLKVGTEVRFDARADPKKPRCWACEKKAGTPSLTTWTPICSMRSRAKATG